MTGKKKILVVEDDPKSLKLVKDLLEMAGHKVFSSGDAEEGISLAKDGAPDLVLMDFKLPGMNGLEAYKILNADERTKKIPLVFVTATVTAAEQKVLEATGCRVILKPINTRTFVSEVEKILNERR